MKNSFKTITIFLLIALLVSLYFNYSFFNKKNNGEFIATKTLECLELWEKKKSRLFGNEIGNYRVIFNPKLNTCLAGNIYDQKMNTREGDKYFIFVIDLITDETLLSYLTHGNEMEYDGVKWEDAIKEYESYGLKVH